jgi:hypothetical protein
MVGSIGYGGPMVGSVGYGGPMVGSVYGGPVGGGIQTPCCGCGLGCC